MRETKKREYKVAVVGGGIAGAAAALSAARQGSETVLIESSFMLGGLATSGLVTIYLPLCDGKGTQLSYGIAEELLRLSVSLGAEENYPYVWFEKSSKEERAKKRYLTQFNPNAFAILLENLLIENGVKILYGATLTGVKTNRAGDKITSLDAYTRTDAYTISAKTFVDATGDATLCALAGEETSVPEKKNQLAAWYYEVSGGACRLKMKGSSDYVYAENLQGGYTGLDGEEITDMLVKSHRASLEDFKEKGEVSPYHSLAAIATVPQLRMTRRLVGAETVDKADDGTEKETSVGLFGDWKKCGPSYELPLGSLYGKKVRNLCAAGRCISVKDDETWDITRVIPVCAVSGEAAGILASVSTDFKSVSAQKVQRVLKKRKVKFRLSEL